MPVDFLCGKKVGPYRFSVSPAQKCFLVIQPFQERVLLFWYCYPVSTCAWNCRAADDAFCVVSIIFVNLSPTLDHFSLLRLSNSTMITPLTTLLSFVLTASCHSMTTLLCRTRGSRIMTRGSENIKANDIDGLGCWNWFLIGAWAPSLGTKVVTNQKASATSWCSRHGCCKSCSLIQSGVLEQ